LILGKKKMRRRIKITSDYVKLFDCGPKKKIVSRHTRFRARRSLLVRSSYRDLHCINCKFYSDYKMGIPYDIESAPGIPKEDV